MHFYSFNIGDYMSHTVHLSLMEDLAYRRCLDIYYLHEKPLPEDIGEVARLIRMPQHKPEVTQEKQETVDKATVDEEGADAVHGSEGGGGFAEHIAL